MAELEDGIRDRFVDEIGEFASNMGLNRSVGQLYAFLYMSAEPVCLDEMAEACAMSKGNVSLNVRELERWGAVRRVWVRGDRKDYYEANRDVPQIVMDRLRDGLGRRVSALRQALHEAEEEVQAAGQSAGTGEFYRDRLREIQQYGDFLERLLKNMDKVYAVARRFM